jgi:hypothetical protein
MFSRNKHTCTTCWGIVISIGSPSEALDEPEFLMASATDNLAVELETSEL